MLLVAAAKLNWLSVFDSLGDATSTAKMFQGSQSM